MTLSMSVRRGRMVANLAGVISSLVLGIWWLSELRCERLLSQAAEQGGFCVPSLLLPSNRDWFFSPRALCSALWRATYAADGGIFLAF